MAGDIAGLAPSLTDKGWEQPITSFSGYVMFISMWLLIYRSYLQRSTLNSAQDTAEVRNNTHTGESGGGGAPPVNNSSEPPVPPSVP